MLTKALRMRLGTSIVEPLWLLVLIYCISQHSSEHVACAIVKEAARDELYEVLHFHPCHMPRPHSLISNSSQSHPIVTGTSPER